MESPTFPWIWTLPITRKTLLVDRLRKECHDEAFLLIQDAAKRGDNMGQFEIATKEKFQFVLSSSTLALVLSDLNTKKVECLILVAPCRYVRSCHPTLCSLYVVTSADFSKKIFWREFIQLAQTVITRTDSPLYSAGAVDVFVTCIERIMALREEGFLITACVQDSGRLAGYPGYCSSYIMYKDFSSIEVSGLTNRNFILGVVHTLA